jgi:hypothetical protein
MTFKKKIHFLFTDHGPNPNGIQFTFFLVIPDHHPKTHKYIMYTTSILSACF